MNNKNKRNKSITKLNLSIVQIIGQKFHVLNPFLFFFPSHNSLIKINSSLKFSCSSLLVNKGLFLINSFFNFFLLDNFIIIKVHEKNNREQNDTFFCDNFSFSSFSYLFFVESKFIIFSSYVFLKGSTKLFSSLPVRYFLFFSILIFINYFY